MEIPKTHTVTLPIIDYYAMIEAMQDKENQEKALREHLRQLEKALLGLSIRLETHDGLIQNRMPTQAYLSSREQGVVRYAFKYSE